MSFTDSLWKENPRLRAAIAAWPCNAGPREQRFAFHVKQAPLDRGWAIRRCSDRAAAHRDHDGASACPDHHL